MRSARTLLVAALAAAALTGCLSSFPPDPGGRAPVTHAPSHSFFDDFDGPAGSPVDPARWKFDVGNHWGDRELEYYARSTENVSLDGRGHLAITAREGNPAGYSCRYGDCRYTSGRILTEGRFEQRYGRFEARIKIPRGQGIWPAFWLLGGNDWPAQGEIDIMENLGHTPHVVHATVHGPGYFGAGGITRTSDAGAPLSDDFHIYGLDWSPDRLIWELDGREYFRVTRSDIEARGKKWVFDHPFFIILNVAVGGAWPGAPDESTVFPQTMLVDWVRAEPMSKKG